MITKDELRPVVLKLIEEHLKIEIEHTIETDCYGQHVKTDIKLILKTEVGSEIISETSDKMYLPKCIQGKNC